MFSFGRGNTKGSRVRTQVEFQAPSLDDGPDEDDRASSTATDAIAALLREAGVETTPTDAWEGYGWYFVAALEGRKFQVLVQGIYLLDVYPEGLIKETEYSDQTTLARLLTLIHEKLAADDRFSQIEWSIRERNQHFPPAPHPLADFGRTAEAAARSHQDGNDR